MGAGIKESGVVITGAGFTTRSRFDFCFGGKGLRVIMAGMKFSGF